MTVVGEGAQNATPDNAILSLGVSVKRGSPGDAMNAANGEMSRLLSAIKAQGVQTQIFRQPGGKIHHLANVPGVIAAAQKAVGDDIQLNGINLTLSDNTTQLQGARQAAMSAAAARAKVWAHLAGRHLGKVLVAGVARRLKPDR